MADTPIAGAAQRRASRARSAATAGRFTQPPTHAATLATVTVTGPAGAAASPGAPVAPGQPAAPGADAPTVSAVLRLPGAAGEPVKQGRRAGRLPKAVLCLWRVRLERTEAMQAIELQAQLAAATAARDECFERGKAIEAAIKQMEKDLSALRHKDDALSIEYGVHHAAVKALKSRICALAGSQA